MRRFLAACLLCLSTAVLPAAAFAAPGPALKAIYTKRKDLQQLFDPKTYLVKPDAQTAATSLEDWARQYGWRENKTLLFYKPKGRIPTPKNDEHAPEVSVNAYAVIDRATGLILAEKNAGMVRPIASLTKLATADIVLARGVSASRTQTIRPSDRVGGSALGVPVGSKFTVRDLFYATFLVSANDAANALAAATGLSRAAFVAKMNARAKALNLPRTAFADPTGIDEGNVSTPSEFAKFANVVFARPEIRTYATTAKKTIYVLPKKKPVALKSSDFLLWHPEYDDVYVTAGKTGYLGPEYGWNLAISLRDHATATTSELIVVTFGGQTLSQSSADAGELARWAWKQYTWK